MSGKVVSLEAHKVERNVRSTLPVDGIPWVTAEEMAGDVIMAVNQRWHDFATDLLRRLDPRNEERQAYIAAKTPGWREEGARLRSLRERAGLTRAELARALDVSSGRIARLEAGEPCRDARLLRAAYLLALAVAGRGN